MDGSGWSTIMLTWFYTLWWFTLADAAKTLIQWVSNFAPQSSEEDTALKNYPVSLYGNQS